MVVGQGHRRFLVAGGIALHADVWMPEPRGDAPGIVLVHGLASNAIMWRGVAGRLATHGHAVVAVDQRGHGLSDKPGGPYDLGTLAADLDEVVADLAFARAVLAGQSLGGSVVLEVAARHPAQVRGVVCVDGGWMELAERFPTWEDCEAVLAPPHFEGMTAEAMDALVRRHHEGWPESGIAGLLANFETRADGTVAPWLTRDRHLRILRSMWEHRPAELYPTVKVPVLLVPAEDPGRPERSSAAVAEVQKAAVLLPLARLHPVTGRHDLHAQHPEVIGDLIHEWASGLACD